MDLIRKLGFGELRMHLMHTLGAGTTQGALKIRLHSAVPFPRIVAAMDEIQSQHAMLNAVILERDGDYFFYDRASREGSVEERFVTDDNWQSILENESNILLDPERNLWRLAVYSLKIEGGTVTDLVLVMHHAVMDAVGSEFLIDKLLRLLSETKSDDKDHCLNSVDEFPIALEDDVASACTWETFSDAQAAIKNKLMMLDLRPHIQPDIANSALNNLQSDLVQRSSLSVLEQRQTKFIAFDFSIALVAKLDRFCLDRNISLNSLLAICFLSAVDRYSGEREKYALFTALSLRPLCPNVEERGFGCYLSVGATFHNAEDLQNIVSEAQSHKQKTLQTFLDSARWVPSDYDTSTVREGVINASKAEVFSNDYGFTYAETSIRPTYNGIAVGHQYVIARRNIGNVSLILHGLRSQTGVHFTLSYVEPIQQRRFAENVSNYFNGVIADIASAENEKQEEVA